MRTVKHSVSSESWMISEEGFTFLMPLDNCSSSATRLDSDSLTSTYKYVSFADTEPLNIYVPFKWSRDLRPERRTLLKRQSLNAGGKNPLGTSSRVKAYDELLLLPSFGTSPLVVSGLLCGDGGSVLGCKLGDVSILFDTPSTNFFGSFFMCAVSDCRLSNFDTPFLILLPVFGVAPPRVVPPVADLVGSRLILTLSLDPRYTEFR